MLFRAGRGGGDDGVEGEGGEEARQKRDEDGCDACHAFGKRLEMISHQQVNFPCPAFNCVFNALPCCHCPVITYFLTESS